MHLKAVAGMGLKLVPPPIILGLADLMPVTERGAELGLQTLDDEHRFNSY
jgi:hypothetical protein